MKSYKCSTNCKVPCKFQVLGLNFTVCFQFLIFNFMCAGVLPACMPKYVHHRVCTASEVTGSGWQIP